MEGCGTFDMTGSPDLMLTAGFRQESSVSVTQTLASWSENIPFTSSKCLSATEGDQIFAASRAGERVLHTELGAGKAEITFKRLGFEMSWWWGGQQKNPA